MVRMIHSHARSAFIAEGYRLVYRPLSGGVASPALLGSLRTSETVSGLAISQRGQRP